MRKPFPIFLILFLVFAGASWGAALTSGADFLLMTTGARPDGMGQAFSAVADDINTLSFNPAGLGNIRLPEIGYGHASFFADTGYDFLGAALPLGPDGVLGLGYLSMGSAAFNSTSNPSAPLVSVQDSAMIAAWGKSFYDLHLGAAVKWINENVAGLQGSGIAFDLGARYRITPRLTVAGSVLNLGPGIQFATGEPLPLVADMGLAWTALDEPNHQLTLAADSATQAVDSAQRFSVGAEYWQQNTFALRAGYLANSQEEGFSVGAGIRYSFFQIDYAFEPYNNLGSVQRISGLFQWDGPWVLSGGEPNPPKYVTVKLDHQSLRVHWEPAPGPVQAYEVLIQPLDGGNLFVSPPVTGREYEFKNTLPKTLYRVTVRSIGSGDARSFPSDEVVIETLSEKAARKELYQEAGINDNQGSVAKGVNGKVDGVGLQLSWPAPDEKETLGYDLYRKSPSGQVEKVTLAPKHANRIWVAGVNGLWGWEWIVTEVHKDGKEKTLGSYLWYPTNQEVQKLSWSSPRILRAIPQPKRQVFLAWDGDPDATGYTLLYSPNPDKVYEVYKEFKTPDTTTLLTIPEGIDTYYLMMVPQRPNGTWTQASREAFVRLYEDTPDE